MKKVNCAALLLAAFAVLGGCRHVDRYAPDDPLYIDMVAVQGGRFMMGDVIEGAHPDALPVHPVDLEDFHISRYEITFDQYDAFALETGRPLPADDGYGRGRRAVTRVSWDDAKAFCEYRGYRLPTEAEWEYASRAEGRRITYPGTNHPDSLSAYAFTGENSPGFTMPVGMKKPNAIGLHDMSGNAAEWIGSYYESYPEPGEEPIWKDLSKPGLRLTRGGSYVPSGMPPAGEMITRTYWRAGSLNDTESFAIGFRCAK